MSKILLILFKNRLEHLGVIFIGIIGIVLLTLPATFFDEGRTVCLSKLLLNQSCWGCGLTRACMHLLHLDFGKAAYYNKLSFVVLPILIFAYFFELKNVFAIVVNRS